MIREETAALINDEIFWTDSQVVLGYIKSDVQRFKIFVANRVQQIRDQTDKRQWHYVETTNNPADDASRGLESKHQEKIKRWFEGPSFLWKKEHIWLKKCSIFEQIPDDDPEIKKVHKVSAVQVENGVLVRLQRLTWNWNRMKRVVALLIKIKDIWLKRIAKTASIIQLHDSIDVKALQEAQDLLFKMVQDQSFANEKKHLLEGKAVPRGSCIVKLDPFLDDKGIIRVGGRLKRSCLAEEESHPVILPKKCNISEMVARWSHQCVGHGARGLTLNHLRKSGVWIISANSMVRHMIHKCVTCRRLRGKLGFQKMADLPDKRYLEAAPFTCSGVDMFRPIWIRERQSDLKRYAALFTCFSSRAVHIKITNTIDADSFTMALRRFLARRGSVRSIWSDNGTNFVGANNELKKALKEMDHQKIKNYLQGNSTDWILWHKNPPLEHHIQVCTHTCGNAKFKQQEVS